MNNKSKILIVAGLVGFVLFFYWLMKPNVGADQAKKNEVVPTIISTDWDKHFELLSRDANGLYLFNYLLKSRINKGIEVSKIDHQYSLDTIPRNSKASFIFIGKRFVLTPNEMDSLLNRVENGSKLFLAQHQLEESLYTSLFDNIALSYDYNFGVRVKSQQAEYQFYYVFQNDTIGHKWRGFENILTSTDKPHTVLSTIGNLENNIAVPYGQGYIYICSNPELFVNYQLKTNSGINHAKIWINRIPESENIYWLELGRHQEPEKAEEDWKDALNEENNEVDDSYLQFIFQKKSLIYAMILLILGIIVYVIFRAKRTQPIVPYLAKKKNMTLLFTDTITSIYFANRNPYVMLNMQKRNFFDAVQKHFFIDIAKRNENKEIKALSQKSNIPEREIVELIQGFETTEVSKVSEEYLVDMSQKLVSFYRRSGLISSKVQEKLLLRQFKLYRTLWLSAILILLGVFTLIVGLYYLVSSIGIGIAFWPIGVLFLTYGSMRISKPFLHVDNKKITYFPIFGKAKHFRLTEIERLETNDQGAKITLMDGKSLIVNYWELTATDAEQFKRFVINQNKLKL